MSIIINRLRAIVADIIHLAEVAVRWKYANWLVGIFLALAGIMLAIEAFQVALILMGASLIWGTVMWWRSEHAKKQTKINKKWIKKPLLQLQLVGALVIILIHLWPMYLISSYAEHKELEKLEGRLLPARDTDPPNSCSFELKDSAGHAVQLMPKDALKVFLGKFMVTYSTFPHNIFTVNGKNPLILDRDASGQIALTMDILDRDEKVVVRFENGHFWVNPNTRAHMDRGDDKSSLVVIDNYGNRVLDMRYLNKHAVVISALLQYSHAKPARIEKTKFADVCLGDVGSTGINFNSPE
jgi:hypothetical protein